MKLHPLGCTLTGFMFGSPVANSLSPAPRALSSTHRLSPLEKGSLAKSMEKRPLAAPAARPAASLDRSLLRSLPLLTLMKASSLWIFASETEPRVNAISTWDVNSSQASLHPAARVTASANVSIQGRIRSGSPG